MSRIGAILSWAIFATAIGGLRLIQDKLRMAPEGIITGYQAVWSIATFFVVPIIAYMGPDQTPSNVQPFHEREMGESLNNL